MRKTARGRFLRTISGKAGLGAVHELLLKIHGTRAVNHGASVLKLTGLYSAKRQLLLGNTFLESFIERLSGNLFIRFPNRLDVFLWPGR